MKQNEYEFCVLRDKQWDTGDETWYKRPSEAVKAAVAYLKEHNLPAAWVRRCFNGGHVRTVKLIEWDGVTLQ